MFHSSQDSVNRPNPRVTKVLVENIAQSGNKLGDSLNITGNTRNTSCELDFSLRKLITLSTGLAVMQ